MSNHDSSLRGLWAAVIVLGALMAAMLSTAALWTAGAPAYAALGGGGVTFIGVATLGFTLRKFLTE
ncbi:hypothetical protein GCM10010249_38110 [Streptomyces roseolilacinus]|uniref:Uncharacterized protein n=1 Tax=Streptomyces roseolilacinus TaxID=66904 RepID=A0A918B1P7_9ACTN|nr:hypothetical protein GCM10010249_38110 [Streptomyces roseolilacinus]